MLAEACPGEAGEDSARFSVGRQAPAPADRGMALLGVAALAATA
jgi:hypothetical protein